MILLGRPLQVAKHLPHVRIICSHRQQPFVHRPIFNLSLNPFLAGLDHRIRCGHPSRPIILWYWNAISGKQRKQRLNVSFFRFHNIGEWPYRPKPIKNGTIGRSSFVLVLKRLS
jgi:hypothetical protein